MIGVTLHYWNVLAIRYLPRCLSIFDNKYLILTHCTIIKYIWQTNIRISILCLLISGVHLLFFNIDNMAFRIVSWYNIHLHRDRGYWECGRSKHSDYSLFCPLIWTGAYFWNCMSHDQRDLKVTYLRNLNFRSAFCRRKCPFNLYV
jgi:hypothetical protein